MELVTGQFKVLSISHDHAPLEQRERVMLNEGSSKKLLLQLSTALGIHEALVLSTCNRTEVYYSDPENRAGDILGIMKIVLQDDDLPAELFAHTDDNVESVKRLFDVSMGLRSQVVGDMQITNQVKKAYQWSADEGMAGPFLHRLMHTVFFTNKRVVQETAFRDGGASISYIAKDLAEDIAKQIGGGTILVLGAGEIGRDLCGNFEGTEFEVFVSNRTDERAKELAVTHDLNFLPFSEMKEFADKSADIIISSVSAAQPVFFKETFSEGHRLKYLIDLSVPRSVDPHLSDKPGFVVYHLDELEAKASDALSMRMEAMGKVRAILEEELINFFDWSRDMIVSPTINKLKNALENIRKEELQRYMNKATEKEQKLLDKATRDMMQKVLKLPVLELKAACKRGEAETLIDVLNDLFDLERQPKS